MKTKTVKIGRGRNALTVSKDDLEAGFPNAQYDVSRAGGEIIVMMGKSLRKECERLK